MNDIIFKGCLQRAEKSISIIFMLFKNDLLCASLTFLFGPERKIVDIVHLNPTCGFLL